MTDALKEAAERVALKLAAFTRAECCTDGARLIHAALTAARNEALEEAAHLATSHAFVANAKAECADGQGCFEAIGADIRALKVQS